MGWVSRPAPLLLKSPCQSLLMILIDFTTSASAPGVLPSKGAVHCWLEMGCVHLPTDFYSLSTYGALGIVRAGDIHLPSSTQRNDSYLGY